MTYATRTIGILGAIMVAAVWLVATPVAAKKIDLSTRTDAQGRFELGFCARPSPDVAKGWPGHTFVSFAHHSPSGGLDFVAIGHTVSAGVSPAAAAWSLFGSPVSGKLAEERYQSALERCLIVVVNREVYEAAFRFTQSPLVELGLAPAALPVFESYKLGSQDCINWMLRVASVVSPVGLRVPTREASDLPVAYVEKLIAAN